MVNNFSLIRSLFRFENPGDFYFCQIIQRKKDNPHIERNLNVINNYFFDSVEKFDLLKERIITECNAHNARAYIRLNIRNYKKVALMTAKKVIDLIISEDYKAVRNAFLSAACESHSQKDKLWLVDIDQPLSHDALSDIYEGINECDPIQDRIIVEVPTKNGFHLITKPFNQSEFRDNYAGSIDIDIHKDNPTILYIP